MITLVVEGKKKSGGMRVGGEMGESERRIVTKSTESTIFFVCLVCLLPLDPWQPTSLEPGLHTG